MSSILDHVEQSVPRATVYGAMKGSPVFIGKYFREINPSSNATVYNYKGGEKKITFIVASPDKTIFHDLRSAYLRFKIKDIKDSAGNTLTGANGKAKISEPGSNIFERICIKMNGTVVEDISRFDYLTSAFKRNLLTREQKNARKREGFDYIKPQSGVYNQKAINATWGSNSTAEVAKPTSLIEEANLIGDTLCVKLDMSGIMNVQQLLSGYYSPLEIELYLQDPQISCQIYAKTGTDTNLNTITNIDEIEIENPRLCMEQIVMSPEYVSAFESALLSNSNAQGIQIPFSTYYTYSTDVENNDVTFWVRKPVRYLRSVYWTQTLRASSAFKDNYNTFRQIPGATQVATVSNNERVNRWQVSIGTKQYRKVDDTTALESAQNGYCPESEIFLAKAVGHYNDYMTETDEVSPAIKKFTNSLQGLDLEYSPDNDVLASETTLNSNDVRIQIEKKSNDGNFTRNRVMVYLNYQASIALFPGNETRLLVT